MKLAFIMDAIYPYNKGGAEKRVYDISTELVERGNEVHVFGMKYWKGPKIIKQDGVFLHGICKKMPLYTKNGSRSITQNIWFAFKLFFHLVKADFDLVECVHHLYFAVFATKIVCVIKRRPFVVSWHEVWSKKYWIDYVGPISGRIGYCIAKFASFCPNKIVAVSTLTEKELIKELKVKEDRIIKIDNGINFKKIQAVPKSKESYDIIFAGRLIKEKNIKLLINAVALIKKQLPSIKCLIVGDGPDKKNLEQQVKKLDLEKNIHFPGFFKKHESVLALMKSAKVFAFSSTREGFGIVAIEANACGLPVVTINHPQNAAKYLIVNELNGFVTENKTEPFKEKIQLLLKNPALQQVMSHNAIKESKKYDWKKIIDKIEE